MKSRAFVVGGSLLAAGVAAGLAGTLMRDYWLGPPPWDPESVALRLAPTLTFLQYILLSVGLVLAWWMPGTRWRWFVWPALLVNAVAALPAMVRMAAAFEVSTGALGDILAIDRAAPLFVAVTLTSLIPVIAGFVGAAKRAEKSWALPFGLAATGLFTLYVGFSWANAAYYVGNHIELPGWFFTAEPWVLGAGQGVVAAFLVSVVLASSARSDAA